MCDICGRGSCCTSFHSLEEQSRYEKVIEAFDKARELRQMVRDELEDKAREMDSEQRRAEHEAEMREDAFGA
jgi:transcription elongation factor Elf1